MTRSARRVQMKQGSGPSLLFVYYQLVRVYRILPETTPSFKLFNVLSSTGGYRCTGKTSHNDNVREIRDRVERDLGME